LGTLGTLLGTLGGTLHDINDLDQNPKGTLHDINDLGLSLTFFVQMRHAASETGCVNILTGKLRPEPNSAMIICATLLRKLV
jgi:hypothetical protein